MGRCFSGLYCPVATVSHTDFPTADFADYVLCMLGRRTSFALIIHCVEDMRYLAICYAACVSVGDNGPVSVVYLCPRMLGAHFEMTIGIVR